MSRILSIDTSTQACSCALAINEDVYESFEVIPRQHAGMLLGMVDDLMREYNLHFKDLDAIAYGNGPGSFTGLRIAAGVVQGIAYGADLPVIPVSTLACQAFQLLHTEADLAFSSLDARIDEVYWGFYRLDDGGISLIGEEGLCKPELLPGTFPGTAEEVICVGSGLVYLERMPDIYRHPHLFRDDSICPRASAIAQLAKPLLVKGHVQIAEAVNPVYLRDKVTHS